MIYYFTLWPWPLTFHLEHLQRIACDMMKLCTKFDLNAIEQSAAELLRFQCLTFLEHCVTCCVRLWDNFHQVWPSTTYASMIAFLCWYVMSCCDLDLWPVAVASLGLVSRGAATDGCHPIFYWKNLTTFLVMTFFSCRVLTTPIFTRRLSNVLSKFSHKNFRSGVTPWRVSPGAVHPRPP